MNILITESQLNIINESTLKRQDLCATFGGYSEFCRQIEKNIKGRKENLGNLSSNFFNDVVKNPKFFKTITLEPGNPEFDSRMDRLIMLQFVLANFRSCPEIQTKLQKDIEVLPKKGLKMVVDENNKYSLLNRLDTHYSAKAYLLTKIILDEIEGYENQEKIDKIDLNDISDEKIREIIKYVIDNNNVDEVSEYLFDLLNENKEFRDYFMGSLKYSRDMGNKVEQDIFNSLRQKYGKENVIEFSGDFGFVDYFGIDGILIEGEVAHPIQISTSIKSHPKIFKYASERCKPLGFYKNDNIVTKYSPEI
jgi:hypothetical protein